MRVTTPRPSPLRAGLVVALSIVGCGGGREPATETVQEAQPAITAGEWSGPEHDATVLLVYQPTADSAVEMVTCTGVLVAPNLVLTARSCVSSITSGNYVCGPDGELVDNGQTGGFFDTDLDPAKIKVFAGNISHVTVIAPGMANGAEVFHDGGSTVCSHDIALLRLDLDVDAPIATLRLQSPALVGEQVSVVGWGSTTGSVQGNVAIERHFRSDVYVGDVGPAVADPEAEAGIGPRVFETGEAICWKDEGSGAFSAATGATLGVASHAIGLDPTKEDPCVGADVRSVFTQLPPWEPLILEAFAAVGHEPLLEPSEEIDETCGEETCEEKTPPAPTDGIAEPAAEGGGCAFAARRSSETAAAWSLAFLVALLRRARSRRAH